VQKQQKEIRELNDRLTKLTENIDERMEVLNDDIRLGYSLSCLLVVFSVAMRV
jgi:peptidoglycan hydrolase CwlO-like protein